jgi:hypothetical protein
MRPLRMNGGERDVQNPPLPDRYLFYRTTLLNDPLPNSAQKPTSDLSLLYKYGEYDRGGMVLVSPTTMIEWAQASSL